MENNSKPFSMDYVLRTTTKHMRKSVDISIKKTFSRIAEFDGNAEKSKEVLETLSALHAMQRQLDGFQSKNKEGLISA